MSDDKKKTRPILSTDMPYKNFKTNVEKVDQMQTVGVDVINFIVDSLDKLILDSEGISGCHDLKGRIQNTVTLLQNIDTSNPGLSKKIIAIRNQSLVLLISNFERFLSDLVVVIVEEYPYLIEWPDKKSAIDFNAFRYGVPTLGEVVLRSFKEKYSFQDLKSILDFSKAILGISINLDDDKRDSIIVHYATRHALVHNLGVIDDKFMKQIRNIDYKFLEYINGAELEMSEKQYFDARENFNYLAGNIHKQIRGRLSPSK